jgi:hypothetical protein
MCGDLEDTRLDDELFAWLVANAKAHQVAPGEPARSSSAPPAGEPGSSAWMGHRFRGALSEALSAIAAAPEGARAEAVGSQAIVLARLAGFLAGHLPPETDIFRNLVDALMDGHREPERQARERRTHGHGHAHGDDHHGHGHEH